MSTADNYSDNMATSTQFSREALCDGLDQLSIQQLELMDHLIKSNMSLEESMRSGFFLLSKTRYTLGTNAVCLLQLPTDESEVESLATVVSSPVVLEKYDGDIMYHSVDTKFVDPVITVDSEKGIIISDDSDKKIQGLRKRVTSAEEQKTEEISDENFEEQSVKKGKPKIINRDPIRWFSALPPQTLKHAQQDFKAAINLIAQCATTQLKLRAVNKEYKRLYEIKQKLDKTDKEE
ncbi:uncharacterized protein LOC121859674 isoform X2 [Homarus americanus]|uniref:Vacuolar ATPase assembly protein VMA22 n=1 Tax=Homarus americanus TaxID=6706 RepID=A0A8J5TL24_HOMAM|nr:uncharacterized protein LOC121859674 isoform X2 [Homarus americanus]KAG7177839.1 Coiled-coil domain-containing protein 115-like [Homarus americanus]